MISLCHYKFVLSLNKEPGFAWTVEVGFGKAQ
jgi:hypothetical protein